VGWERGESVGGRVLLFGILFSGLTVSFDGVQALRE
jgi:hypothetical protein